MFLRRLSHLYELVIFTASLSKYADAICDILDENRYMQYRLYREHCTSYAYGSGQVYIKDLNKIGRNLKDVIILDNSPVSYLFHESNALPIRTWVEDPNDIELYKYLRLFEYLADVDDVRPVISQFRESVDFELVEKLIKAKKNKQSASAKKPPQPQAQTKKIQLDKPSFTNDIDSSRYDGCQTAKATSSSSSRIQSAKPSSKASLQDKRYSTLAMTQKKTGTKSFIETIDKSAAKCAKRSSSKAINKSAMKSSSLKIDYETERLKQVQTINPKD